MSVVRSLKWRVLSKATPLPFRDDTQQSEKSIHIGQNVVFSDEVFLKLYHSFTTHTLCSTASSFFINKKLTIFTNFVKHSLGQTWEPRKYPHTTKKAVSFHDRQTDSARVVRLKSFSYDCSCGWAKSMERQCPRLTIFEDRGQPAKLKYEPGQAQLTRTHGLAIH